MCARRIEIFPVPGIGEIHPRDDLAGMIAVGVRKSGTPLQADDVVVAAQKIVSKAEGRIVDLASVSPSNRAADWAAQWQKDPRQVEVVLRETKRVVRMERGIIISETQHGFICANAGVDASNSPPGCVILLPENPDHSAENLREKLALEFGVPVGVIISDTFGRPWRRGLTNVALGVAGIAPMLDHRGTADQSGRTLHATVIAIADEIAAAAELVMGKVKGIPAAIVRGVQPGNEGRSGADLIRDEASDLFR